MELEFKTEEEVMEFFRNRHGFLTVHRICELLVSHNNVQAAEIENIKEHLHNLKNGNFLLVQEEGADIYHEKFSGTPDRFRRYFSPQPDTTVNDVGSVTSVSRDKWWKRPEIIISIIIALISIPWWPSIISYFNSNEENTDGATYYDAGEVPGDWTVDATEEYSKIKKLSAGLPVDRFKDLLGDEVFVNKLSDKVIEYVFVNPLYYVEAAINSEDTVIFYSVTTRKTGFNPKFEFGPWYVGAEKPLVVELGKTTYSELNTMFRSNPVYATYSAGVNQFYYFESYYAGRPGNYQSFIFSTNQAGATPSWPPLDPSYNTIDNTDLYSDTAITDGSWIEYRDEATINTYTETVPYYGIEDILNDLAKQHFGPNLQQARLVD